VGFEQYVKCDNKLNVEELSEGFTKYEEINLKTYATDDGQLDKYMLFKHPHKTEVKDKFEALVRLKITFNIFIALNPEMPL
jgi:hypothetical protein